MTVATIGDVVARIVTVVKAVSGIRTAPDYPPDQIAAFPAVLVYPSTGTINTGDFGIADGLHDVAVEIRMPDKDLPHAMEVLIPFLTSIPVALTADPWMNQQCEAFPRITYSLFYSTYDTTQTVGFRFIVEKIRILPTGKR